MNGSRGRRRLAVVLGSLIALLGIGAIARYIALLGLFSSRVDNLGDPFVDLRDRPTAGPAGEAVNLLLLGTDGKISGVDPATYEYGAGRTDAIMLLHIPADRAGAYVIAFPSDLWVPIPEHGEAKLNAAYAYGGPSLLIRTMEQLTDVRIDHFAIADFEGFAELTDELGGVEIEIAEDAYVSGELAWKAGTYKMDGAQALDYVRERYALPGGDFDRVQRQQNWIRAIARQALTREVLSSPAKLLSLTLAGMRAVAVDDGLTLNRIRGLTTSMTSLRPEDVAFLTVPHGGVGRSATDASIVVLDRERLDPLCDAIREDRFADYLAGAPDGVRILGSDVK